MHVLQSGHDIVLQCENDPGAQQVCYSLKPGWHLSQPCFAAAYCTVSLRILYRSLCISGVKGEVPRRAAGA